MDRGDISDKIQDFYNNYYNKDESSWRMLHASYKVQNIIELIENININTILEIGAGEGAVLQQLSDQVIGKQLYALEVSDSGIAAINKRNIGSLIESRKYDGYNIPYKDDQFDLVVITHVLEHVEYPRKLLYEAARVGKYVFIEVPLEDNIQLSSDFTFKRKSEHINFYSPRTIRKLLQTCNYTILAEKITNPSKNIYLCKYHHFALCRYYCKKIFLKLFARLVTNYLTYDMSFLCNKNTIGYYDQYE